MTSHSLLLSLQSFTPWLLFIYSFGHHFPTIDLSSSNPWPHSPLIRPHNQTFAPSSYTIWPYLLSRGRILHPLAVSSTPWPYPPPLGLILHPLASLITLLVLSSYTLLGLSSSTNGFWFLTPLFLSNNPWYLPILKQSLSLLFTPPPFSSLGL